ncbi:MAG: phosphate ABC transporter permease subunit PstC, partial [Spirochaetia bacterium]|nr:phosphate ABC transporter permease subunit PstC [Spirochaetia bacterium]
MGCGNPSKPTDQLPRTLLHRPRPGEIIIQALLFLAASISIFTTLGIVASLGLEAFAFFRKISLIDFFTDTVWQPAIERYGILPLLSATLATSFWAMLLALPLGLLVAIYLSEYAPRRVRDFLKPVLELLAGIPTVVYGYFALNTVTPLIRNLFGRQRVDVYNTLSA